MKSFHAIQSKILSDYQKRTSRSRELHARGIRSLPRGETRSITFFAPYPTVIEEGRGCSVIDADGNEYLDVLNNYTALIHGHGHPRIAAVVAEQAARMTVNCSPHELQFRFAEEIVDRVSSVDKVCFANSGTEAVLNAIRLARAYSGRLKILKMEGGYHGMLDAVSVSVDPGLGAPRWPKGVLDGPGLAPRLLEEVLVAPFNDLETTTELVHRHREELAAVIVEPVMGAAGIIPADPSFLQGLQQVCRENGVLLIFDEIITFRLAPGGAQSLYQVRPDLTTFGKIIGGGLPVGAFGGREDVMSICDPLDERTFFHSGTFTGNLVTMAAGIEALKLLDGPAIQRLNGLGDRLRERMQQVLDSAGVGGCITGIGSLLQVHMADPPITDYRSAQSRREKIRPWFHLALLNRGIFGSVRGLYSLSTPAGDDEIDQVVDAFRGSLEEIQPLLTESEKIEELPLPLKWSESTGH